MTVAVCPRYRPQRKGVVEAAVKYARRSWWRTAQVSSPADAQASLERWCIDVADRRRRRGQTVAALAAFTTRKPCRRRTNRPPTAEALTLAAALTPAALTEPEIPSLDSYAALAVAR